ncbi:MAG: Diaminopimelate epimerase [Immundisolibacter sp.]|nr:diaminopimelate epimerase [Immundisolibacter sp.]MEA3221221.1 Diaminopimelate epimerase [Immundisolibacter sp.]
MSAGLRFTKMHGLGNDFVVIDGVRQAVALSTAQIRALADRHFGVGCDQVLLLEAPRRAEADFTYRIFNADGGEVEHCGNGARCAARFVHEQGLSDKTTLSFDTLGGLVRPRLLGDGQVEVEMGVPCFEPARIPFEAPAEALDYPLQVEGQTLTIAALAIGNPHAVLRVPDVDSAPVGTLGPLIEAHARFPRRVNVGFLQVVDRREGRLRVYERGAGETLACGTGACAAFVAGVRWGLFDAQARLHLPGGVLELAWAGPGTPVFLTGPAVTVFEGTLAA